MEAEPKSRGRPPMKGKFAKKMAKKPSANVLDTYDDELCYPSAIGFKPRIESSPVKAQPMDSTKAGIQNLFGKSVKVDHQHKPCILNENARFIVFVLYICICV